MTVVERQASPAAQPSIRATSDAGVVTSSRVLAWARANWAALAVFLAFALAAVIVPTFAPVATTDDWAYARSAQILLDEARLTVFPVVAATAVFQIVWGALFGLLFGPTLGAFRLSTVAITALGGIALYGLCRDLGVCRTRSALGVAAYLFNPLAFVMAFTFMTDAHFAALLVIAAWLFAKALRGGDLSRPGSAALVVAPCPTPGAFPHPNPSPSALGEGLVLGTKLGVNPPFSRLDGRRAGDEGKRQPSPLPHNASSSIDGRLILAGSIVSALAFLTRQQGALIVPAMLAFLLLTRRLRRDRASALLLLQLLAPLLLTMAGYYLWLRYGNDVPRVQASFFREVLEEGWSGTWWLLRRLTVVELIYLGLFTLPLMAAALPFTREMARGVPRRGWALVALWAAIAIIGVATLWQRGARMPYIAQFFGGGGLGPPDLLGSRPILLGPDARSALTVACLVASLLLALLAARGLGAPPSLARSRAGLVLGIGLGQVVGVLPPSYHYIGWAAGSLDRYLLPLVPLAIALALWGLRGVRLALPLGWLLAIALALFSIAGTRDYLVFMREIWAMGDRALAAGVPLDRLDAGSGWDGYHLYEYGLANHIRSRTPKGGPWWVYFYAPATDSAYVVAGKPLRGFTVVSKQPYSSWLQRDPPMLYLLRRYGAPWPPIPLPRPLQPRPAPTSVPGDGAATATEASDGA